ncbi:MAG: prepilin-type N-terminal cleavage/methylation domain-containing protein [Methylotenera sp.]|nr:prepilin-type N-terminal cleavage/methylation domain-containing protein [Methylotenera sp.]
MKQFKSFQAKQAGFTLLELLVVITLLAILSVGALVAYEGVGDNAQATAAANNTASADRAIRNFRAVTQNYPDQWDSLVTTTGVAPAFLAATTQAAFANLALPVSAAAGDFRDVLDARVEGVGIGALQARVIAAATPNVEPNLQHNEGALGAAAATDVVEEDFDAIANFSILPSYNAGDATAVPVIAAAACSVGGVPLPATKLDGTTAIGVADGQRQNAINDGLESSQCNFVLALGFGHDAAHSTNNSSVAISTAPTYLSKDINPATSYARYVALFHVGADTDGDNNIVVGELFAKPRLLAVVDTEGKAIDQSIAASNP